MLPGSPAWIFGLPNGIWALVVLSKPEVIAIFLGHRRGFAVASPVPPQPRAAGKGRVRAFLHSVGRYCFTRFSGRQPGSNLAHGEFMPQSETLSAEEPNPPQSVSVDY